MAGGFKQIDLIMIQEKKCKGQGKAISFKGCGKPTNVKFRKLGLCTSCYPTFLMDTEVGKIIMQKALFKVQKPRLDFQKAEQEHKEKPKLKLAHERTKQVVHAYVRERDKGLDCISCYAPYNSDFQAGHFFSANSFTTLKYNLDNIHGQCVQCNLYFEGAHENYSLNLPKRIGQQRYNELVKLAEIDKHHSKIWNLENLKEIRETIKKLKL
jgi:hypothetical protein